jgi:septum formation protein
MAPTSLVLASASPRRHELLRAAGLRFTVVAADVDESVHAGEAPITYVERVAGDKAAVVAARLDDVVAANVVVLAADTTVDVDGEILAKPVDDDDARRMLRLMAGRTHHVHTAVVARTSAGPVALTATTAVTFSPLDDAAIERYLALGEHRDKAGGYGMQGSAAAFVERLDGSPTNVIGLPLAQTVSLLAGLGVHA